MVPAAEAENNFNQTDRELYSVIYHMSTKRGYCWASNHYLAVMLKLSPVAISNSVSKLRSMGYVKAKYSKDNHRHIYPETNQTILDRQRRNIAAYLEELEKAAFHLAPDEGEETAPPLKESLRPPLKDSLRPHKESLTYIKENNKESSSVATLRVATDKEVSSQGRELTSYPPLKLEDPGQVEKEGNHHSAAMKAALREQMPGESAPDKRRREESLEVASEEARLVLDLWNSLSCGTVHAPRGAAARRALYLLDQSILPKNYFINRIVSAVIRYKDMAAEPDRWGLPFKRGSKLSLENFLSVPKYLKQRAHKYGRPEPVPIFQQLYGKNGDGVQEYDDEDREVTEALKQAYVRWTRGVERGESPLSRKEELDLLQAGTKLRACMAKGWLDPFVAGGRPTHRDYINILFQGLKRKWGTDYTTGHLASGHTWNDLMPKFIQEGYGTSVVKAREGARRGER
jgi:Mn-dependent DtxR family transcriptional regulator